MLSLSAFQPQIFQHLSIANSREKTFTIILNYNHITFPNGLKKIIKIPGQPSADCDFSVRNRKQEFLQRHRGLMDNCQSSKETLWKYTIMAYIISQRHLGNYLEVMRNTTELGQYSVSAF